MTDSALEHLALLGLDYETVEYGRVASAEEAAAARGIELRQLIKTLVVRRGEDDYVFVMVTGDSQIDWKKLRGALGVRRMTMPGPDEAREATGYARGTITPLGSVQPWPVLADVRVAASALISLGSGRHGRAIHLDASALLTALGAQTADIAETAGPAE
ncbi:MAG TPA: YbaK/EbsC family protein [Acidimicrobiia bacterium]|jgi:Cys-tRNA(Pro) deacylase|nr:YbaK/EbsC family protein [Acidimicrobiia bacterium]